MMWMFVCYKTSNVARCIGIEVIPPSTMTKVCRSWVPKLEEIAPFLPPPVSSLSMFHSVSSIVPHKIEEPRLVTNPFLCISQNISVMAG